MGSDKDSFRFEDVWKKTNIYLPYEYNPNSPIQSPNNIVPKRISFDMGSLKFVSFEDINTKKEYSIYTIFGDLNNKEYPQEVIEAYNYFKEKGFIPDKEPQN